MAYDDLALLRTADDRWLITLASLTEPEVREPSLLPGWSRAHVAAHVTLNGEAFRRVLTAVLAGEPASMYDSNEARDADIEELSAAPLADLVTRSRGVAGELTALLGRLGPEHADVMVDRLAGVSGGVTFPVRGVLPRRLNEVWIHLADLGLPRATRADWPVEFTRALIAARAARYPGWAFAATDLPDRWGDAGAPTLSGSAVDLAWWLTGRGDGEGLTSSTGALPEAPTY